MGNKSDVPLSPNKSSVSTTGKSIARRLGAGLRGAGGHSRKFGELEVNARAAEGRKPPVVGTKRELVVALHHRDVVYKVKLPLLINPLFAQTELSGTYEQKSQVTVRC